MELWGILIGGLIAAVAGVIGHTLSRNTEHGQWRRDKKLEAYVRFLEECHTYERDVMDTAVPAAERRRAILRPEREDAYRVLGLLAPLDVGTAAANIRLEQYRLANLIQNLQPPEGKPHERTETEMREYLFLAVSTFQELAAADLRKPHRRRQVLSA
jgi:hypothetical protein